MNIGKILVWILASPVLVVVGLITLLVVIAALPTIIVYSIMDASDVEAHKNRVMGRPVKGLIGFEDVLAMLVVMVLNVWLLWPFVKPLYSKLIDLISINE